MRKDYNDRNCYVSIENTKPLQTVREYIWCLKSPVDSPIIKYLLNNDELPHIEYSLQDSLEDNVKIIMYKYTGRKADFGKPFGIRYEYEFYGVDSKL